MKTSIARNARRAGNLALAHLALLAVAFTGTAIADISTSTAGRSLELYVDPSMQSSHVCDGSSSVSCQIWEQTHGAGISQALGSMISAQPQAVWFTDWNTQGVNGIRSAVAARVSGAMAAGRAPQLVSYMIPQRDCASLSSGGAPDLTQWASYIRNFALGIKDGLATATPDGFPLPVIVMLEPDALALLSGDDGCKGKPGANFDNAARLAAIRTAIGVLGGAACSRADLAANCPSFISRVHVYLDAGHAAWKGWPANIGPMAQRLIDGGITNADGFFTNVSNYSPTYTATTDENGTPSSAPEATRGELAYGKALLDTIYARLGNTWGRWACGAPNGCEGFPKKQIIDTSRNGPIVKWQDKQTNGWPSWCDNQLAGLGEPPTLYPNARHVGFDHVVAALWVKPPGETDGCEGGSSTAATAPAAGQLPTDGLPPGLFHLPSACRLMGRPDCAVDITRAPPRPSGLRITHVSRIADGAPVDSIMLEWNPSYGTCGYQIARRMSTSGGLGAIAMVTGTWAGSTGPGPETHFLVLNVRHGAVSQYAVRARNCGATAAYSSYSPVVTTRDFP